jgi:DNA topoisomerase-1
MPRLAVAPLRTETDPVSVAAAAKLHHVDDRKPGLRRRATGKSLRVGKRFIPQFVVFDADGGRVRDAATLARIRALAIPPAWTDVWICPRPDGHLQATGRDARGRKQYRYHTRWRERRDENKYARMIQFAGLLPALRRQVASDLTRPGLPRPKVLATVVKLLETTFIRVGNEEYARSNRSFGLTTLEDRHVDFRRGVARFHFRGKSGVFHQVAVEDPRLARIVRQCRDLPGQELFQYRDGDGNAQTIDSADVNDYIHREMGEGFTAKDFRTWAGTVLAAVALDQIAAEAVRPLRASRAGAARAGAKDVARAVVEVAARLRNTPAVCRKCYIHPAVIAAYFDGSLALSARSAPRKTGAKHRSRAGNAGATGLRPEETAVLALLRRQVDAEERPGRRPSPLQRALRRSLQLHRHAAAA